jgi:hypothetical protein
VSRKGLVVVWVREYVSVRESQGAFVACTLARIPPLRLRFRVDGWTVAV